MISVWNLQQTLLSSLQHYVTKDWVSHQKGYLDIVLTWYKCSYMYLDTVDLLNRSINIVNSFDKVQPRLASKISSTVRLNSILHISLFLTLNRDILSSMAVTNLVNASDFSRSWTVIYKFSQITSRHNVSIFVNYHILYVFDASINIFHLSRSGRIYQMTTTISRGITPRQGLIY